MSQHEHTQFEVDRKLECVFYTDDSWLAVIALGAIGYPHHHLPHCAQGNIQYLTVLPIRANIGRALTVA